MPRTGRVDVVGACFHVMNRGNARARVFHDALDYAAFQELLRARKPRRTVRLVAYCLMPNHFHLVVWPDHRGALSRWMQWLLTSHVRRHHQRHGTSGRIWQGRYKSFPIQRDRHLLAVMRYVERNPLRAGLVGRAREWHWSSLHDWLSSGRALGLDEGPIERFGNWLGFIEEPGSAAELEAVRASASKGRPFGSHGWVARTVAEFGLESSMRSRGRPRRETCG